ncbi:hypothetical protein [Flavonifractor plautii]|uniref:Transposase, YhgA-like n=1 Tax=Flavonifractor plautii TaxID=292800 RepID=A0A6I2R835_FLAPL|nr:hypothetical protein [Flavonifractor plautii]MDB7958291.1 hypothetical protein [Flavonifractor plautii]MSB21939.1 hypothetical protein [Flavonifractor plautii]MSB85478.1 hypothetical protein [Flavonifractor plautii]
MPEPKRDIKDSVFTFLFSDIEYTKQLYLSLHPEDTDIRDEDFRLVTLENILAIGQYNDLGFQVRDKLILLVEAQSTFSPNIPLRMLMYLAKTYNEYIEEHQLSLYREKKVSIPRPELYVIYTGEKEAPDILRLSDMYEGSGSADLTVRVLRDGQPGDILSQYVDFCQVANEQVSLYGRTDEALMSTIQLCLEQGILVPFLDSRKKEVVDIMTRLFSQEKAWEMELAANARENREAGRVEGRVEGRMEAQADMLRRLLQKFSILEVSQIMGIPQSEIERLTKI